jgi:peptidoglycan/xylan/chitin deacetylase (PgdA/CDA1 family)
VRLRRNRLARLAGGALAALVCGTSLAACQASTASQIASGAKPAVNNDCHAGTVAFTFDDGPGPNTPAVLDELKRLHLHAVFFVLGDKIAGSNSGQKTIRQEVKDGFTIGDHTWDHKSFTGASTGSGPMNAAQITSELNRTADAIVAAGAPRPTLYRPPYGDITPFADNIAHNLGFRIVMPWTVSPNGNIVDSRDWDNASVSEIVKRVTVGIVDPKTGKFRPGMAPDAILAFHDGETKTTINTMKALPKIAAYMNAHGYCSSDTVRPDATGGFIPVPAPPLPDTGNLVTNWQFSATTGGVPDCFARAGSDTAGNTAAWSLSRVKRPSGVAVAQTVAVSHWSDGDRKLVISQFPADAKCVVRGTPGQKLHLWVEYQGAWPQGGDGGDLGISRVALVTYYRTGNGTDAQPYQWHYWETGPLVTSSPDWSLAYMTTSALPDGATGVSFGLALRGNGTLTVDRFGAEVAT